MRVSNPLNVRLIWILIKKKKNINDNFMENFLAYLMLFLNATVKLLRINNLKLSYRNGNRRIGELYKLYKY